MTDRVLEPGFGDGSFLIPIIEKFLDLYEGPIAERLKRVLNCNIWGVEIDPIVYNKGLSNIEERIGVLPDSHNLTLGDFLDMKFEGTAFRPDTNKGLFVTGLEFAYNW